MANFVNLMDVIYPVGVSILLQMLLPLLTLSVELGNKLKIAYLQQVVILTI